MPAETIINSESETNSFTFAYIEKEGLKAVEVSEIDMSGWTLFECYLPQDNEIIYFEWNDETQSVTLMDMETQDNIIDYSFLTKKIIEFKGGNVQ